MNILHLLSQSHLTGAEVYASTLADVQNKNGHSIWAISNGFYCPTPAHRLELKVECRSKILFIKNIFYLRKFVREKQIHVIHCHSRAAAKLAYWATLFSKTAQVSTIHGVQHSSISKKLFNQYGQKIIAVCENIKQHVISDFKYRQNLIEVIGNPVSKEIFNYRANHSEKIKKIAIVGRTTGPKALRTELVIHALSDLNYEINLLGGSVQQMRLSDNQKSKIVQLTESNFNSELFSKFDLIIGSGRVCIEALMSGVPCIAFGEAKYIGRITVENYTSATESNFGDIHPESLTPHLERTALLNDIIYKQSGHELQLLAELAQAHYEKEKVTSNVTRIYESAYFLKNYSHWIPVLMYHKIPNVPVHSQHKIYVTKERFASHLNFFKRKGFTTLTFSELSQFRKGLRNFSEFPKKPLLLTFDDGYMDNIENAAPLLRKNNFKATVFLLANNTLSQNSWDTNSQEPSHEIISGPERKKLWPDSPFEIGSHGFNHQKLTDFNDTEALRELSDSKLALETEFAIRIPVFAFTYGIRTKNASQLAQQAGYEYAVNTDSGGFTIEEQPYSVFRVNIFPDESMFSLWKKTSRWYRKYYYFKRGI